MQGDNLFTRPDTFFGVCQGLGEDLGFHPNILRIALAGIMFWNPAAALAAYAGVGLLVGLTRWLVPNPRTASSNPAAEPVVAEAEQPAQDAADREPMPLAA